MSFSKDTISIHFVREALACLERRGLAAEPFLLRAGIPPQFLREPLARVSAQQFGTLWRELAHELDDEFFGLDSHPLREGSYALMCQAALGSATLRQALVRILKFMRVGLDDLEGVIEVQGPHAVIRIQDRGGPRGVFAYATYLIMVYGLACWLVRRRLALVQGQFRCAQPPEHAEYRVLFCEQLRFDAEDTALTLPAACLDLPVVQTTETLRAYLREAPANFLVKYRNPKSLAARIRRRLREQPPAQWPTLQALCAELHLTEATLRRRLRDEGQSFQSLKDDLRRDLAILYLRDPRHSVPDIAARLGFAEPSSFYKAFGKWTGSTPAEYRRGA